jgi:uncharacterized protein
MEKITSNKVLFSVLIIFLAFLVVWVGADIKNKVKEGKYIGRGSEFQRTIQVSGTGEVYTKPDLAITSFSVVTEKKTVEEALLENTRKMNGVIEAIKAEEVEEKDLKTTSFSIYPRYEWRKSEDISFYPEGERVLVGYEISQSLQVKIRNMERIGEIIQKATRAGANQVGNLQFAVDKEEEFKDQAREKAIEKAKEKAETLSLQLGIKLVKIVGFSESSQVPRYDYYEKSALGMGGEEEASPQIESGENKIEVSVIVIYEIN